jgi:hypothetical protein
MKKLLLFVSMLLITNSFLSAQIEKNELNQADLLMPFVGNWKISFPG